MPVHIHTAILDVAVITGGVVMISSAAGIWCELISDTGLAVSAVGVEIV